MKARHVMLAVAAALFAFSANAVDLHGYFRQGVGGSSKGGDQVAFQNAGQDYKLRLGNEDDWSEFEFVQPITKDKNGVEWTAGFMLGWGDGWSNNRDLVNGGSTIDTTAADFDATAVKTGWGSIALQQSYIKAMFPQLGGATVWGGKRFYHRHANDIIDYFYMNESGPGVGIEDVPTGFGKFAAAVFRFNNADDKGVAYWMPDIRLEAIPVNPGGTLDVAGLFKLRTWNKDFEGADAPDKTVDFSYFFMVKHSQSGILNGGNNLAVTFKNGYFLGGGDKETKLTVSEDILLQPTKQLAVAGFAVYNRVNSQADVVTNHFGVGVRPLFKVSDHFALQGNAGYYYNKSDESGSKANSMFALTFAPTITPFTDGYAWGVRPEIRFYVNYASWNKEQNPTDPTTSVWGTDTNGVTFGSYVETWF